MLRSSGPTGQGAGTAGTLAAIQPTSDHHAAHVSGIELTNGGSVGSMPITKVPPGDQGDPDTLDPGQASAALRRGMPIRPLRRTRATGWRRRGRKTRKRGLFGELFDPLASMRTAEFHNAIARLREIDPDNPNLTYVAPPNWIPPQDAIDRINDAATAASAASSRQATFGFASSTDYRATFFTANPELKEQVVVHHTVEQQALTHYPDFVTGAEINSLENLRGIPKDINSVLHLSRIR